MKLKLLQNSINPFHGNKILSCQNSHQLQNALYNELTDKLVRINQSEFLYSLKDYSLLIKKVTQNLHQVRFSGMLSFSKGDNFLIHLVIKYQYV